MGGVASGDMLDMLPRQWVRGGHPRKASGSERGEIHMKKLLVALALGVAGVLLWRKVEASKAENASWAGVTDSVE